MQITNETNFYSLQFVGGNKKGRKQHHAKKITRNGIRNLLKCFIRDPEQRRALADWKLEKYVACTSVLFKVVFFPQ